jgi:predicted ATPase
MLGRIVKRDRLIVVRAATRYVSRIQERSSHKAMPDPLTRLGERETAAIIAHLVGNKELPADVMAEIVERTDGIPLFVEEMTKAGLEAESEGAGIGLVCSYDLRAGVTDAPQQPC